MWWSVWNPRLGIATAIVTSSLLYLAAMPAVATRMLQAVEVRPRSSLIFRRRRRSSCSAAACSAGDGGRGRPTRWAGSLERRGLRRARLPAAASPVAVSGGRVGAARMQRGGADESGARRRFHRAGRPGSRTSRARPGRTRSTPRSCCRPDGITTVVLVTQAWHLPRALWSFERAGLHALPWPAPRITYDGRPARRLPAEHRRAARQLSTRCTR